MSFPTTLPSYSATSGSESANTAGSGTGLSGLLNAFETDITGLGTKMGTGSSAPAANTILYGTGAGTSAWQGLTSAQVASLVSDETGSGSLVFGSSPTIVTPTIASFANATHNHSNAAGGGQLGASAIATGTVLADKLSNPYKFSVYLSVNQSGLGDATFGKVLYDTELFDTNSNFDNVTNFRYTIPVSGFYQINAHTALTSNSSTGVTGIISLYKNGVEFERSDLGDPAGGHTSTVFAGNISDFIQFTAGDYIEIFVYLDNTSGTNTISAGVKNNRFNGFLVCAT